MRSLRIVQGLACAALVMTFIPFSGLFRQASVVGDASHQLSGELRLVGSRGMHRLAQRWARDFTELHPEVRVTLAMTGSGTAAGALAEGDADIAPLARELTVEERALLTAQGISPLAVRIGTGAYGLRELSNPVSVYVNASNRLPGLTVEQLGAILLNGAELPHWRDISSNSADAPDCRIRLYGVGWSNGTSGFLKARLLYGNTMRTVLQLPRGSTEAIDAGRDPCTMGFGSPADAPPGTRFLAIRSSAGFVTPTERSVASGAYPLARGIYVYLIGRGGRPVNPNAAAFVRFVLDRQGRDAFEGQPYLPLPARAARKELSRLGLSGA